MSSQVMGTLGKYQLIRKLATGGMAEVYLAKVAGPGGFEKTLVLKRVLPHLASDENFIAMFLSEAKLAAQLSHPNVVSIFDFGQEGETWFLVMEYIDGPNLRSLYKRAFEVGQPPPFNLAAKIISQACEGLAYAHEFVNPETGEAMELVHRDISPDNILLGRNGGVKVVDFGIAKAARPSHHTKTGTIKGKFAYMAPEQLRGLQLDRRADVFALGIVLYELISGTKPFDCSTDATIMQAILFEPFRPAIERRPDTPPELQQILDRALAKDRDQRYADCRELQAALDHFIVAQGVSVGQQQLAQLVARLANPSGPALATPSPKPSQPSLPRPPGSGPQSRPSAPRPIAAGDPTQPAMPTPAPSRAPLPAAPAELPAPPPAPARGRAGLLAGLGVLTLVAVGGTYGWVSSQRPPEVPLAIAPPVPPAPPASPLERVAPLHPQVLAPRAAVPPAPFVPPADPGAAPPSEPPVAPANRPVGAATKIGRAPKPSGKKPLRAPEPSAAKAEPSSAESGLVDFRVRPYASVFVDGTFYGVTPFEKLKLPVGVHSVKLVNKDIGKEVTVPYEVKAGENTLKYNLETE